jgi:hypothetical protein
MQPPSLLRVRGPVGFALQHEFVRLLATRHIHGYTSGRVNSDLAAGIEWTSLLLGDSIVWRQCVLCGAAERETGVRYAPLGRCFSSGSKKKIETSCVGG